MSFGSDMVASVKRKKLSEHVTVANGNVILLKAADGTYLKRHVSLLGNDAVFAYQRQEDPQSEFVIHIFGNEIQFEADNGRYLKREHKDGPAVTELREKKQLTGSGASLNFVSVAGSNGEGTSKFTIHSKGGNKVTIQADSGEYLQLYSGYQGQSFIALTKSEDSNCVFEINVKAERKSTKAPDVSGWFSGVSQPRGIKIDIKQP